MSSHNATEQPEIPLPADRFENESPKTRRNSTEGKESAIPWKQHSPNILIHFSVCYTSVQAGKTAHSMKKINTL